MTKTRVMLSVGLALSSLVSSQAVGRGIVIDVPEFLPSLSTITPCTIGAGTCDPVATNLSAPGFGSAYIYDRGIVSFGDPLPGTVGASTDITTLGIPVIAPLYEPGAIGDPGPFTDASFGNVAPGDLYFDLALPTFGSDLFVVTFLDPTIPATSGGLLPITALFIDASSDELRFQFVHGMFSNAAGDEQAVPSTAGRQFGYAIDGQNFVDTSPDLSADNAFSVKLAAVPSVPEPGTWLSLLLGFGAMGLAFRRSRRPLAPAFSG